MGFKEIRNSESARKALFAGAARLADAVKVTMGPRGRYVVLEQYAGPLVTKDGGTVAAAFELSDPFENAGAQVVRQVAAKTGQSGGDGTTTATVLAQAILREGRKLVATGSNPQALKRGIDRGCAAVIDELGKMAEPCRTREARAAVATVAANEDAEIGGIVADALEHVGGAGVVTTEEGSGLESELQVVAGTAFQGGYLSPHFLSGGSGSTLELERPLILVCARSLSRAEELLPLLESAHQAGRPLLVIAEGVEGQALELLTANVAQGRLAACAVKPGSVGEARDALLEDLALLTGARLVSEHDASLMESGDLAVTGEVQRVRISASETLLLEGKGEASTVSERIARLEKQRDSLSGNTRERELLSERIQRLAGTSAVIHVGGATEPEMRERLARTDDALRAARAASEEGTLPGGGVALVRAAALLDAVDTADADEAFGLDILRRALHEPLQQIVANAGLEPSVVLDTVAGGQGPFGIDVNTGEYGDMTARGIVDAAKVTRIALENAAGVAGLLINTEAVVADKPKI